MQTAGLSNYIAQTATVIKSQTAVEDISTAVIKQILDTQRMMGDALVKMIQQSSQTASPDPMVGRLLDIFI